MPEARTLGSERRVPGCEGGAFCSKGGARGLGASSRELQMEFGARRAEPFAPCFEPEARPSQPAARKAHFRRAEWSPALEAPTALLEAPGINALAQPVDCGSLLLPLPTAHRDRRQGHLHQPISLALYSAWLAGSPPALWARNVFHPALPLAHLHLDADRQVGFGPPVPMKRPCATPTVENGIAGVFRHRAGKT